MYKRSSILAQGVALTAEIAVWEDDPMSVPEAYTIRVPAPELDTSPLAIQIIENAPVPAIYAPGTREFRYWTAAAALRRATDYWSGLLPSTTDWKVGPTLPVRLDGRVALDAYYARDGDHKGLSFFHDTVNGKSIYTGESSDVVCHELGHAILDTIRPDLFDAVDHETAAFHESFADISSILSALQMESLREAVLVETNGDLHRSSRLSRLAEQLGWAIRQETPDKADSDCLRNAVNSFCYEDPTTLPLDGPNSILTREEHSFSRVFTGGFFDALANMLTLQSLTPTESDLLQVSQDAGKLLVTALQVVPANSDFYSQVATYMIEADRFYFNGKYSSALTSAFVRRGILSLESAAMISSHLSSLVTAGRRMTAPRRKASTELPQIALSAANYGLRSKMLLVSVAGEAKRLLTAAATSKRGMMPSSSAEKVAKSFVDDLFQRGNVDVGEFADVGFGMVYPTVRQKTHKLIETSKGLALTRAIFR